MGETCSIHGDSENSCIILVRKFERNIYLRDDSVAEKIILKLI
jgi:hypothetical protein